MPNIDNVFSIYAGQLELLRQNGLIERTGEYICPICLNSFNKEQLNKLSMEDAPQASLGGKKIAITCKKCNNTCGHETDIHLVNFITYLEEQEFFPGSNRRVKIFDDETTINANLEVGNTKELKMIIPNKINNPKALTNHLSKLTVGGIIDIQNHPLKIDMKKVSTAILKNAYIILFARFGYSFLLNSFYDRIREQILNPAKHIIPESLWTKQTSISVKDGIYFSNSNVYRVFFIIYSLTKLRTHHFCICIPTPQVYFEAIAYYFREYKAGIPIYMMGSDGIDYFQNIDNIKALNKWLVNWSLGSPV